jgi:hypothetical protein
VLTEGAFSIAQYPENTASPAACTPGTHWEAVPLPLPSDQSKGYPSPTLSNVACTSGSPAACVAVGAYANDSGDGLAHAYIDSGSGTDWHAAVAPLPGNATDDNNGALTAVACGTACAAIGQYRPPSGSAALIEGGSGGSWTPVQAPVPGSAYAGSLSVVACGTSCVAAGKEQGADGKPIWEGLLEAGSGASWSASVAALPADALTPNAGVDFTGAACASSTCLVYGTYEDKNEAVQGLVETEAGGKWTAAKLPYPSSTGAGQSFGPTAAACQSAAVCTIVGTYDSAAGAGWTAMVTGSGAHWEAVALPNAYVDVTLNSMSCPTASSCTATGAYQVGGTARILAVTGSGSKWTERFAPLPPHGGPSEGGVAFPEVSGTASCTSATACVTVGGYYADSLTSWPYISAEQGGSWGTVTGPVPSPHTSDPNAGLNSVECPSASNCVAVGTYAIPVPPGQFLLGFWELPYAAVEVRN